MEAQLRTWDGESITLRYDRLTGAYFVIAVHSTRLGPGSGGTRLLCYPDLNAAVQDAQRLAQAMTYKFAIAGLPRGGGKAVIYVPADLAPEDRPDLLRRFGRLISQLDGYFSAGPDLGISLEDLSLISETGRPHVYGLAAASGGSGDTGSPTARGVLAGMEAVAERLTGSPSLSGLRVLVQGAGSVGGPLIAGLLAAGAEVLFSDLDPAIVTPLRGQSGLRYVAPDRVFSTPCDIFAPCAIGGILNQDTIPLLQCRAVAGGANNQLAQADDAERLRQRGILYAPDYVLNGGGAISVVGQEILGWTARETEARIQAIRETVREVFALADAADCGTETAARRLAESRLRAVDG